MKKLLLVLILWCVPMSVFAQTTWTPTLTDSLAVDGVCSLREAFRACFTRAAVDTCAAGHATAVNTMNLPAGTFSMSISGGDNTALAGDLDIGCNLKIFGAGKTQTILDANSIDRVLHWSGTQSVELHDMTIREGCSNGGTCNGYVGGVIPAGGAFYNNSSGHFWMNNVRIESNVAAQGGGVGICASTSSTDYLITNSEIVNNTATGVGGGGLDVHMNLTIEDTLISGNTSANSFSTGGGIRTWDRNLVLNRVTIEDNISAGAGGGIGIVGHPSYTTTATVTAIDSTIDDNIAAAAGGGVFVNAGSTGTGIYSSPCGGTGCVATFVDSVITDGTADSPSSAPAGSGGNLHANTTSSIPGRINLEGITDVSGGVDATTPSAPDCEGAVHLYDSADVANTTGCTITDHRPTGPVCGNTVIETGEDCDSTACCNATSCLFEIVTTGCSDGDVCTVGDECDGAGDCVGGSGTPCGDGTLQTACGEQCDDGNSSNDDDCSASCISQTCVAWE